MDWIEEPDLELEDLKEQAEEVGKLTPREFARLMGMSPQLVYYHIRTNTLETERCICGRRVLDVASSQQALQEKTQEGRSARASGSIDRRSDAERDGGSEES